MNENSKAIIVLCSHLCMTNEMKPLEPAEWKILAGKLMELKITPEELINLEKEKIYELFKKDEAERLLKLIERSASIFFEISKLEQKGIKIVTRADKEYPIKLKNKLGASVPPLFYYIGDLQLLNNPCIGIVGSRKIEIQEQDQTKKIVINAIKKGYAIVSGGAKGIDSVSSEVAILNNGVVIEYISDSLLKKIKDPNIIKAIRNKKMVILSQVKPDFGFNTGFAMARNKYIYTQSEGTVVIKSDFNKGGTWSGATEAIKKYYTKVFVLENQKIKGNSELISKGAIPITEDFDFELEKYIIKGPEIVDKSKKICELKQMSLFDNLS